MIRACHVKTQISHTQAQLGLRLIPSKAPGRSNRDRPHRKANGELTYGDNADRAIVLDKRRSV